MMIIRTVLLVERSMPPAERLRQQNKQDYHDDLDDDDHDDDHDDDDDREDDDQHYNDDKVDYPQGNIQKLR